MKNQSEVIIDPSLTDNKRLNFTRKVLSIVAIQLILTASLILLAMKIEKVNTFCVKCRTFTNIAGGLSWARIGKSAYTFPTNYIILFALTLFQANGILQICDNYGEEIIIQAFGLTFGIVLILTLFAFIFGQTIIMIGEYCVLILTSASLSIIYPRVCSNPIADSFYPVGIAFCIGFYIIYDISLMLDNQEEIISIDNYIYASLRLYKDIIKLFEPIIEHVKKMFDQRNNNQV